MRISDWSSDVCSSDLNIGARDRDERRDRTFADRLGARRQFIATKMQMQRQHAIAIASWRECSGHVMEVRLRRADRKQLLARIAAAQIAAHFLLELVPGLR